MKISGKFVRNFRYCYQSSILFKECNFIKSSSAQEQNILSSKGMIYKNCDMINEPIYLSHLPVACRSIQDSDIFFCHKNPEYA